MLNDDGNEETDMYTNWDIGRDVLEYVGKFIWSGVQIKPRSTLPFVHIAVNNKGQPNSRVGGID